MATIGGARALGMERMIGSLEAGKRADLIIVSIGAARQTPIYDPVSHLVYVTRGDDVRTHDRQRQGADAGPAGADARPRGGDRRREPAGARKVRDAVRR